MNILKEIIGILKIIGVSIAGVTFVIILLKMAINPDEKKKYINLSKNLILATILIILGLSITEIPMYYFGDTIKIADEQLSDMTFEKIVDKDVQRKRSFRVGWKLVCSNRYK